MFGQKNQPPTTSVPPTMPPGGIPGVPNVPTGQPTPPPSRPTPRTNSKGLIVALIVCLVIILVLVLFLLLRPSGGEPAASGEPVGLEIEPATSSDYPVAPSDREQLSATPRGQTAPSSSATPYATDAGQLVTTSQSTDVNSITALGPGTILFGDYAFTTFQNQIIKIPLSCTGDCPSRLTLNLQTYTTPGSNTARNVSFPLVTGRVAGPGQLVLYENDNHERLIADVIFSLLENRRESQTSYRDSFNFGTLTSVGLYLFIDNAPLQDFDGHLIDTASIYLMTVPNSVPALLYNQFAPSVAYAGQLYDGEPEEIFYESTLREDLGIYTHKLYVYFPEQNILQPIFEDLTLLGITDQGQMVIYYPQTAISSPQVGIITINPALHGIKGNQIIIQPEDMPTAEIPDYADGNLYFVTSDLKIYHSTIASPRPQLVYDFAPNFRSKSYTLTNWWYAHSNNNHPGLCLCSTQQVQKDGTGAFYDFQLYQFIDSSPDCAGRAQVGTWYCS